MNLSIELGKITFPPRQVPGESRGNGGFPLHRAWRLVD